jgi:hypothetical protein
MAKSKFDGVIEAVRYTEDGKIDLVRAYERRGAAFSDRILLKRVQLVERLQKGEKFVTGERKEFLAGTFEIVKSVCLNGDVISTGDGANHDLLEDVPIF